MLLLKIKHIKQNRFIENKILNNFISLLTNVADYRKPRSLKKYYLLSKTNVSNLLFLKNNPR